MKFIDLHCDTAGRIFYENLDLKSQLCKVNIDNLKKGGAMGINFCSNFLGSQSVSSLEEMIFHIKHIKSVGGIDVLAIGSDFDGIINEVEIKDSSELDKLYVALKKNNFNESEIEKVFYKNVIRVFIETLK